MTRGNCGSCRFWSGPYPDGDGYCHRFPPVQPELVAEYPVFAVFPHTDAEVECGEWSQAAPSPSDGGFLMPAVIDVDVSGPVRRFFAHLGLAKRKYEQREFAKDIIEAMRTQMGATT